MAAALLDISPAELKRYIHTCYYGHFADHFGDQLLGESVIHDRLGLDPLGNVGVKTGGATGGSTLWEGCEGRGLGLLGLRSRHGLGADGRGPHRRGKLPYLLRRR